MMIVIKLIHHWSSAQSPPSSTPHLPFQSSPISSYPPTPATASSTTGDILGRPPRLSFGEWQQQGTVPNDPGYPTARHHGTPRCHCFVVARFRRASEVVLRQTGTFSNQQNAREKYRVVLKWENKWMSNEWRKIWWRICPHFVSTKLFNETS